MMNKASNGAQSSVIMKPEEEVEALLPWYVAKTVSDAERAQVERALATDPALRQQLELITDEMHASRIANERAGHAPPNTLGRLLDAIENSTPRAHATTRQVMSLNPSSPVAGMLDWLRRPGVLAPVALAAMLLLVGQAAVIASMLGSSTPSPYVTASVGSSRATGTLALVAFTPAATSAEIDALLAAEKLRIIDGPLPGGVYRVQLSPDPLSDAERDVQLDRLRNVTRLVRLVQPVGP